MAIPSFPDIHVTGPVQHYIRAVSASLPPVIMFLGTAEVTPQMQRRKYKQNIMNDLAGKTLPIQKTYDGEAATVSVLLSRFSKAAWGEILEAGFVTGLIPIAGTESRWARGAPVYGQMTFELWQVYENFFNPAGTSADMEIGWYWPQVELVQHDTIKAGTQGECLLLVLDCTPQYIPQASHNAVNGNERGWVLYSNNPAVFPLDVRVPQ